MIEIERKFLVKSTDFKNNVTNTYSIKQGFLNSNKNRTVRVRLTNNEGFITVKGKSSYDGTERFEWEKQIETHEAKALLAICEDDIIDKTRYEISVGNHLFEVDEFHGENQGLIIAELELEYKCQKFPTPNWLGKEVTGKIEYYNSQLSKNPYKKW